MEIEITRNADNNKLCFRRKSEDGSWNDGFPNENPLGEYTLKTGELKEYVEPMLNDLFKVYKKVDIHVTFVGIPSECELFKQTFDKAKNEKQNLSDKIRTCKVVSLIEKYRLDLTDKRILEINQKMLDLSEKTLSETFHIALELRIRQCENYKASEARHSEIIKCIKAQFTQSTEKFRYDLKYELVNTASSLFEQEINNIFIKLKEEIERILNETETFDAYVKKLTDENKDIEDFKVIFDHPNGNKKEEKEYYISDIYKYCECLSKYLRSKSEKPYTDAVEAFVDEMKSAANNKDFLERAQDES